MPARQKEAPVDVGRRRIIRGGPRRVSLSVSQRREGMKCGELLRDAITEGNVA